MDESDDDNETTPPPVEVLELHHRSANEPVGRGVLALLLEREAKKRSNLSRRAGERLDALEGWKTITAERLVEVLGIDGKGGQLGLMKRAIAILVTFTLGSLGAAVTSVYQAGQSKGDQTARVQVLREQQDVLRQQVESLQQVVFRLMQSKGEGQ